MKASRTDFNGRDASNSVFLFDCTKFQELFEGEWFTQITMMNGKKKIVLILSISIAVNLCLISCKNWEYNVVKNGIHFEKIHQSKKGTNVGYMTENHVIQGFPCEKGWIHLKKDWQLRSCQLSVGFIFKGTLLPAHTWFHFPYQENQKGFICSFPNNYEVQGYICGGSGGYKGTHTRFYENGKLRSFFPPEDVTIDGIPCESSLMVSVKLNENGNIKSCKLAEDYQVNGKTYKSGMTIEISKIREQN